MTEMERTSAGAGADRREALARGQKHLPWAIPLLILILILVGGRAIRLRGNLSPATQPGVDGQSAARQEATPGVQAVEPTPKSITSAPTADLPISPREGALAPDFTLTDLNGAEWTLSALRGSAVMLNFWATW